VVACEGGLVVLLSEDDAGVAEAVDGYAPFEDGVLCEGDGFVGFDHLVQDGVILDILHELPRAVVLASAFARLANHPRLGLHGKVDPAVEHEEERMGDGQLRVAHESLEIVVHGVMTILKGIFIVLVVG
jgi:hypothetical protein